MHGEAGPVMVSLSMVTFSGLGAARTGAIWLWMLKQAVMVQSTEVGFQTSFWLRDMPDLEDKVLPPDEIENGW
jgi:hypothetical protein